MDYNVSKLSLCPWEKLQTNNGSMEWLFKFLIEDDSFLIALSDISFVYVEVLMAKEIESRCKELNKRLEAPVESVLKHLHQSLTHHRDFIFLSSSAAEGIITISFSNHFHSGIPFNWRFECKQGVTSKDCTHSLERSLLYDPLIISISRLQHENTKLKDIIKQKDNEINDYRDSGYKVSRPHLHTSIFDSASFEKELKSSREYAFAVTKEPIKSVVGRSFNDLLISSFVESKSNEMIELTQAEHLKTSSSVSSTKNVFNKNSPKKRTMKCRKPRPAVRGCVLDASDEETFGTTSSTPSTNEGVSKKEDICITPPKKPKTKRKLREKLF